MDVDQPTITEDVGTNADRSQRGLDTALREGEEQAASSGSFKGNEEPHRDVVQDLTDVAAQVTNLSGLEAAEPGSNTSEKDLVTGASGTSNDQPAEQGSQYPTEGIVQLATDAKQNDTVPQDVPSQVDGATQRDKNSRSEVSDDQVAEGGAQEARDSQSGAAVEQKEASEGEGIVEGALEPQVDGATEGAQVEAPDQEQDAVAGAEERPR
jgi:hypothetical protein